MSLHRLTTKDRAGTYGAPTTEPLAVRTVVTTVLLLAIVAIFC